MSRLPVGTVTLLFTDIQGSTRLLQHLGDRYSDVLTDVRRLLRAAVDQGGGREVDAPGDAFFAAFTTARDAVSSAVAAQRAILTHPWAEGASLLVRMALHTGEPIVADVGYVGLDIHRVARICGAAHGGQILLSETTATLVRDDLPPGADLLDLGEHRLKDLDEPERIFQLVHPDLPADFPPPRTLSTLPNNLPRYPARFIGRTRELAEVKRLLSGAHLLTLTGAGGVGKTRLAVEVAGDLLAEFPQGVWLVELAPLVDPDLVPQAVAAAMHIREQPGRPFLATLQDALRDKRVLIVLDNCEHVVAACAHLVENLLRACKDLRVLATSREALGVPGEITWAVPSLTLPDLMRLPPPEQLKAYEAVQLFVERALGAQPAFRITTENAPAVAQVVHRLDGIPLAIEMAASRLRVLAVEQIASRLDDRFRLLTAGARTALPRHQTLRATMDWSYDLLTDPEGTLLRRLSVFAGGWSLEAAEAVCAGEAIGVRDVLELVTRLVDKSLVVAVVPEGAGADARYWLLETVRQYAAEKLRDAGEETLLHRRHRDYYLEWAEHVAAELHGSEQLRWLERLERERDNVRAALQWSGTEPGGGPARLRLAGALWWFWLIRGPYQEGREWLDRALADPEVPPKARVVPLTGAAVLAFAQGDLEQAGARAAEALSLARESGDPLGLALALGSLAEVTRLQGDPAAVTMAEESLSLFRAIGADWGAVAVLTILGRIAAYEGDFVRAATILEESLAAARAHGDTWGIAWSLIHLGSVVDHQGDYARAGSMLEESLASWRMLGDPGGMAYALRDLGFVALHAGDGDRAAALWREALTLVQDQADVVTLAQCLEGLSQLLTERAQFDRAAQLLGAAEAIRESIGAPVLPADRPAVEGTAARLQSELGDDTFTAARAQGKTMTPEDVISFALAAVPDRL